MAKASKGKGSKGSTDQPSVPKPLGTEWTPPWGDRPLNVVFGNVSHWFPWVNNTVTGGAPAYVTPNFQAAATPQPTPPPTPPPQEQQSTLNDDKNPHLRRP